MLKSQVKKVTQFIIFLIIMIKKPLIFGLLLIPIYTILEEKISGKVMIIKAELKHC